MNHLAMEDQNLVEKMIGRQLVYQGNPYQLWLDVTTLRDLLTVTDPTSLRAEKLEEALGEG